MESPAANPAAICKENTMAYPLTHALARPLGLAAATLTALLALAGAAHAAPGVPQHQTHAAQPAHYRPAPPPPRYERAPAARRGMAWSQGYWQWRGQRYAWVPGHWVQARHGQHYRQPGWAQRQGQWHFTGGGWGHGGRPAPQGPRPGGSHRH